MKCKLSYRQKMFLAKLPMKNRERGELQNCATKNANYEMLMFDEIVFINYFNVPGMVHNAGA